MEPKMIKEEIIDTCEDWENGKYGQDAEHAERVGQEEAKAVDDALGLEKVSIKMDKELIKTLSGIASYRGLTNYKVLMRDVLQRFADAEAKAIMFEMLEERKEREAAEKVA